MDPLSLLREWVSSKLPLQVEGEEIVFGDIRYNKEDETAWKARGRVGRGTC